MATLNATANAACDDIDLRNRCSRWLNGHRPLRTMRESLLALAEQPFWLGARAVASQFIDGGAMVEVVIGDAADGWADDDAMAALHAAMQAAG